MPYLLKCGGVIPISIERVGMTGGSGISTTLKVEVASSGPFRRCGCHPHNSKGKGGSPRSPKKVEVTSSQLLRWRWHPQVPLEGGGCLCPVQVCDNCLSEPIQVLHLSFYLLQVCLYCLWCLCPKGLWWACSTKYLAPSTWYLGTK